MTLYQKAETAFTVSTQLLAVSFFILAPYAYVHKGEYIRQPDLSAFIDQKIEDYDREKASTPTRVHPPGPTAVEPAAKPVSLRIVQADHEDSAWDRAFDLCASDDNCVMMGRKEFDKHNVKSSGGKS